MELKEDRDAEQHLLSEYLATLPPLRQLRVERVRVAYEHVFALPLIEHLDIRGAYMVTESFVHPPASPHLRRLLLQDTDVIGDYGIQPHSLLAALASTSLLQLSFTATLDNDQTRSLTLLQSLTALELQDCYFVEKDALSCLISEDGEPLLPNLQRVAVDGCHIDVTDDLSDDDDAVDDKPEHESTFPPFLSAYGRQLQHLKLSVTQWAVDVQQAVLYAVITDMPRLESLELTVHNGAHDDDEEDEELVQPCRVGMQHDQQPTLPALRSLTIRNILIADAAMAELLTCCPQLLELTINNAPLTDRFWPSLMRCRQLLSFCFWSWSPVLPNAAVTRAMSLSSSSASRVSNAPFPSLVHLGLSLPDARHINLRGLAHLLGLFARSPVKSMGLCLPRNVNYHSYVTQLASLPHLSSLRLEVYRRGEERPTMQGDSMLEQLQGYSDERRWSSEQHHVTMQHYWHDRLLGEEADELRALYAAGVKTPLNWPGDPSTGWRVFAGKSRSAFFESL